MNFTNSIWDSVTDWSTPVMNFTYSIGASVMNWSTPTLLFCFLNIMIGTIFFTSTFKPPHNKYDSHERSSSEGTTPSQNLRPRSLFERVKTINFSLRRSDQHNPFPSMIQYDDKAHETHESHYENHEQYGRSGEEEEEEEATSSQSLRPPSLLQRVKSINLSFSRSDQPSPIPSAAQYTDTAHEAHEAQELHYDESHEQYGGSTSEEEEEEGTTSSQLLRPPSLLERMKSINLSFRRYDQPDPVPSTDQYLDPAHENHHIIRTQSEASVEIPTIPKKVKKKMQRSASEKVVALDRENEEEEEEDVDWRRPATARERKEEDEAGDREADDFILRFRQQLKLQRVNSNLRYTEMINRGA